MACPSASSSPATGWEVPVAQPGQGGHTVPKNPATAETAPGKSSGHFTASPLPIFWSRAMSIWSHVATSTSHRQARALLSREMPLLGSPLQRYAHGSTSQSCRSLALSCLQKRKDNQHNDFVYSGNPITAGKHFIRVDFLCGCHTRGARLLKNGLAGAGASTGDQPRVPGHAWP